MKRCDGVGHKPFFADKKVVEREFCLGQQWVFITKIQRLLWKTFLTLSFLCEATSATSKSHLQSDGVDGSISESDESGGRNCESSKNSLKIVTSVIIKCREVNVQVFHRRMILKCGCEIKWRDDYRICRRNFSNCLEKPGKFRTSKVPSAHLRVQNGCTGIARSRVSYPGDHNRRGPLVSPQIFLYCSH